MATSPIPVTQLFSRAEMGALWKRRTEFDSSTQKMIDRIYNSRKVGTLQGQQEITYDFPDTKIGRTGFGRLYSKGSGLEKLQTECRATLCADLYHDLDIVNCQPTLLVQMVKRDLEMDMPALRDYNANRDALLAHVMARDSVQRESAKQEILSILFGGSTRDPVLLPLYNEVRLAAKGLSTLPQYRALIDVCREGKNIYGSFLAALTQTSERVAMLAMRETLLSTGWSPDVLAFDGIMVRKRPDAVCDDALIARLSDAVKEATGFDIQIKEKPMVRFADLGTPAVADTEPLTDDKFACRELVRLLGDDIVKQDGIIHLYNPETGMWDREDGPLVGLSAVHRVGDQLVFKRGDKTYNYGGCTKNIRAMLTHLLDIVPASDFMLDNVKASEAFLLFQDGIYDMKAHLFTPGFDRTKVFTARIMRPFPARDDAVVDAVNKALFVNPFAEEVVGNWLKNILARALAGHASDKVFHVLLGEPNTGKSTMMGLLRKTFGSFVKTWSLDNLKYKTGSTTDEAKQLSWVAPLLGARIAMSSEARMDGVKLDGNLTKRLSAGDDDPIILRQNFKNEREHTLMTTFFALANDIPAFSPEDAALRVRLNYGYYSYTFVPKSAEECGPWEKPADVLMKDKVVTKEWKDAFTLVILDAYGAGVRLPTPVSVKAATDEAVAVESSSLKTLLAEEYEFVADPGEDDYVATGVLLASIKSLGLAMSDVKIARELTKMGLVKGTKKVGGKAIRYWKGIR